MIKSFTLLQNSNGAIRSWKKKSKKPTKPRSPSVNEEDKPLSDALQEWLRQKTLIHAAPPKNAHAEEQTAKQAPQEQDALDLITISDDEVEEKTANDAKRPSSGDDSDNSNKRMKLTDDPPNDNLNAKKEISVYLDIIDEGIPYIDDPTTSDDAVPTTPNDTLLTIMPVSYVSGLHANHDLLSNVVYVVKTRKNINNPKNDVIPASSHSHTIRLPGNALLSRNNPVIPVDATLRPYEDDQDARGETKVLHTACTSQIKSKYSLFN